MEQSDFKVLVCGSGDVAQVAAALFAARYRTVAMSLTTAAVQEWKTALGEDDFELSVPGGAVIKSKPAEITDDPRVAKGVDLIVLVDSPLDHGKYLEALAPHMRPQTIVAAMPLRPDADRMFESILGDKANAVAFCGYEALPWATRVTERGRKACIIGTQDEIMAAVVPQTAAGQVMHALQSLDILGISDVKAGRSVRSVFLRNPAYLCHPGIMFGRWCPAVWDGEPVETAPLFYHSLDDSTESVLLRLGDETQATCKRILDYSFRCETQALDLKDVPQIQEFMTSAFASSIRDASTLKSCLQTNSLYHDIKHACQEVEGGVVPDFQHGRLSEDVLIGLAFVKGLAQIAELPTPTMDEVIEWAQQRLDLEIVVDGKLVGRDLCKTCAPQAMGIMTQGALYTAAMTMTAKVETLGNDRKHITPATTASSRTSSFSSPHKALVEVAGAPTSCFYGWAIVWVCAVCLMCGSAGGGMLNGWQGHRIQVDLGFTNLERWLIVLVGAVAAASAQPMLGSLFDRYGGRVCVPIAQVLFGLALAWASVVKAISTYGWLHYSQCLTVLFFMRALSKGALSIFPHACVQQWFERRLGRAMSIMNLLEYVGLCLLAPVIFLASDDDSWRFAIWVGAVCNLVVAPLSILFLRNTPGSIGLHLDGRVFEKVALDPDTLEAQTENRVEDMASKVETYVLPRSFRIFWVYTFFHSLIMVGTELYIEDMSSNQAFLSDQTFTPLFRVRSNKTFFMWGAMASVVTQLFVGNLMDRLAASVKRLPLALLCCGIFVLAFSNLALVARTGLHVLDGPQVAALLGIARGFSNGLFEILLVSGLIFPTLGVPRSRIGKALSYNQMAFLLGSGSAPLVFGIYSQTFGSYLGIMLLSCLPAFAVGGFLALRLVKPQ
jgi:MFS family permease